jgi:hypothetical protein
MVTDGNEVTAAVDLDGEGDGDGDAREATFTVVNDTTGKTAVVGRASITT